MSPRPPILEPLWDTVPPEAQTAILAVLDAVYGRVAELEQRIRDLEARLKLNSTNSSKPPSSDPIGFKRKPPTPPSAHREGFYAQIETAYSVGMIWPPLDNRR